MFRILAAKLFKVASPVCMLGGLVYFGFEDKNEDTPNKKCVGENISPTSNVFRSLEFQLDKKEKLDSVPPPSFTDPRMKIIDLFITPINQDVCQSEDDIRKLSIKLVPKKTDGINISKLGAGDKGPYLLECQGSIRTSDGAVAVPLVVFLQDKWALSLIHHTLEENVSIHKKHLHSFGLLSFYGLGSRLKTEDETKIKCRYDAKSKGLTPVDKEADSTIFKQ